MGTRAGYGDIANVVIRHQGEERTLSEWAKRLNVPYATARMRYARGKRTFEDIFKQGGVRVPVAPKIGMHSILLELYTQDVAVGLLQEARQQDMTPMQLANAVLRQWLKDNGY